MMALGESARARLDEYLRHVEVSLKGCTSVDPADVRRDVADYVDNELADRTQPVTLPDLESVLQRLGAPDRWIPAEERPWWRRILLQWHAGPEDWRLAYIALGLFIAAFVLIPISPVLLLAGFAVARAALAFAAERGESIGPKKWLLYPPLVVIYLPLCVLLLLWPLWLVLFLAAAFEHSDFMRGASDDLDYWLIAWLITLVCCELWWVVAGVIIKKRPNLIRTCFRPFGDQLDPRWAKWLAFLGAVLVLLSVAMCWHHDAFSILW